MKLARSRVARFLLQFAPLFVVSLGLYWLVMPYYEQAVHLIANAINRQFEPPLWIEATEWGYWKCMVGNADGTETLVRRWFPFLRDLVFLDLALVPALLLATPTTLRVRLRIAGLGIVLAYVGHVLVMLGLTRGTWCLAMTPGSFFCMWLMRVMYTSGQTFGAAIWALLAWRYWFPGRVMR